MPMKQPSTTKPSIDEIFQPLDKYDSLSYDIDLTDTVIKIKAALEALFEYVIGVADPCDPDCSDVRHAFHEGAYQLTLQQEKRLAEIMGKQSSEDINE